MLNAFSFLKTFATVIFYLCFNMQSFPAWCSAAFLSTLQPPVGQWSRVEPLTILYCILLYEHKASKMGRTKKKKNTSLWHH